MPRATTLTSSFAVLAMLAAAEPLRQQTVDEIVDTRE